MSTTLPDPVRAASSSDVRPIRVVSVSSNNAYVRHTAAEAGSGFRHLGIGAPGQARADLLDPDLVLAHGFEVFHLHSGFQDSSPADLARLVAALTSAARPFVFTVHQLVARDGVDDALHQAQLDVLIPAADQLITLTTGAADEIRRRWGRQSLVLPHPHVVDLDQMAALEQTRRERSRESFRVGVQVSPSLGADQVRSVVETAVAVAAARPDTSVQLLGRQGVGPGGAVVSDPDLAWFLWDQAAVEEPVLDPADSGSLAEFWEVLAGLDVVVLTESPGTHSTWLEACRDVGTTVIAPSCGYYDQQGPVLTYRLDPHRFDPASLVAALQRVRRDRPDLGATVAERRRQRQGVAVGHELIYRSLIAR